MSFTPRYYQTNAITNVLEKFNNGVRKVLLMSPTGSGKTVIFTTLTKTFVKEKNKRVLILCHREELIDQTINSLLKVGVISERVTAKQRKLKHHTNTYVAMIETAFNRLKKNPNFFNDIDLIICDECHILVFNKVFDFFPYANILGCSATPVLNQREKYFKCEWCSSEHTELQECCGSELMEWTRPLPMARFYDDIVVGATIGELINHDPPYLVPEISFVKKYFDTENLKVGSDGDYTTASMAQEFNKDSVMFDVVNHYKELCLGKKTMIFTSNTKANVMLLDKFKENGIENVMSYDSINNDTSERKKVLEWFAESQDRILLNTGVFTTGFDDREVEAIIMARATTSLSLFLQIVGRGGRTSDKILKDSFIFIDGGDNIAKHLEWSDDTRDWEMIFYKGVGEDKPKKQVLDQTKDCDNCGAIYLRTQKICPECGIEEEVPEPIIHELDFEEGAVLEPIKNIPKPNGQIIYNFVVSQQKDINFAFRILENKVVDMFHMYRVDSETYLATKKSGELQYKIKDMINKCYHVLVSKKDIIPDNWQGRTIQTLINRTITKLDKKYDVFTISEHKEQTE